MILAVQSPAPTLALVATLLQLKPALFLTHKHLLSAILQVACSLLLLRSVFQVKSHMNVELFRRLSLHRCWCWCFCLSFRADLNRSGALSKTRRGIANLICYLHLSLPESRRDNLINCWRLLQKIGLGQIQRLFIIRSQVSLSHSCLCQGLLLPLYSEQVL